MDEDRQVPLSFSLWQAVNANREAGRRLLAHLGMGQSDLEALEHLMTGGPLGPVELGARLGLRSASATALVDRLEAMGHVERRRHPSDRRRLVVVPTEHAQREASAALQPLIDGLDAAAAGMPEEDQEVVRRYLERATAAMRDYRPPER